LIPLFVGDQHISPTPYYQSTPMLGRLLAEWGKARAGRLFLPPFWHPMVVAEQIGTRASIAHDRLIMQCGLGWKDNALPGYRNAAAPPATSADRFQR
jgi:alkanesulfonate monooxygenase SsuD/methylene tetrahydromethanopterin reductase-like flavin-dependent oxidoreductase (luciferase family)